MFLDSSETGRNISAKLCADEVEKAKLYIKGSVHCFCKNNPDIPFSVRVLFGGVNKNWDDTPLQPIYNYYETLGYTDAEERAAIDVGRLLKTVLSEDEIRTYTQIKGYTNEYIQV